MEQTSSLPDPSGDSAKSTDSEAPPTTLEEMLDWLAERERWLRNYQLASGPRPIPKEFEQATIRAFPIGFHGVANDPARRHALASEKVWNFYERSIQQAQSYLDQLNLLDAPAWQSGNADTNVNVLKDTLNYFAALRSFIAQRVAAARDSSHSLPPQESSDSHDKNKKRNARRAGRDKKLEARDKWIYKKCCAGVPHKEIVAELKRLCSSKRCRTISTAQGIRKAASNYAERHQLPAPPSRIDL